MRASAASAKVTPGLLSSVTALAGSVAGLFSCSVPALMVVAPFRLWAPLRVSVPVPSFCNPPLPLITPAKSVLAPLLPTPKR